MPTGNTPFYLDWTFWAFFASAVAIVLSQLPPVRQWLNPGKFAMEVSDRVWINHVLGFPNMQIYLSLRNVGGKALRLRAVYLDISRHGQFLTTVEARNYFTSESGTRVPLLPFNISPGSEWAHRVNAFVVLVAKEDRDLARLRSALKTNIVEKQHAFRKANPEKEPDFYFVGDTSVLQPLLDVFQQKFMWEPGEYVLRVRIVASKASQNTEQTYRFTVYEADSEELRRYADDYKYGFGSVVDSDKHEGVICQLYPV
jgi:hypothetical protein